MLLSLLRLQLQQQPPAGHYAEPFFTNDGIGLIKLFGVGIMLIAPVLGVVYKLTFNQTREDVKGIKRDVDGQGRNFNEMQLAARGCETRIGTLEREHVRMDDSIKQTVALQAEMRASLQAMANAQTELQRDIMSAISVQGTASLEALHDLKIEVARLDERGNERARFTETLGEITTLLRQSSGLPPAQQRGRQG